MRRITATTIQKTIIQWAFILSVILSLAACGQIETLPAEQPAWDADHSQDVIAPYRAYKTRNIYQYGEGSIQCFGFDFPLKGYIVPSKAENQMVAVLYQIESDEIPAEEMDWQVRDGEGNLHSPVGFGGPNDMMVVTYGLLKDGAISDITGGEEPLFALAFMLPRDTSELTLIDSRGQEGALQLSGEWKPGLKHEIDSFRTTPKTTWSFSCGEGWTILPSLP
jgi:hypothetical protein